MVKTSEKLRALDTDKRILDIVLDELRKVVRGQPGRVIDDVRALQHASRTTSRSTSATCGTAYWRAQPTKNEFVKANLRLVVSIARRFNHGRMPLADLIQEGNIGLIKAVERYDYRRGYRFSTYASWWIRHAISRALADKGRAVRLPVHMIDAYHRVAKSQRELPAKLGRAADQRGARGGDRHRRGEDREDADLPARPVVLARPPGQRRGRPQVHRLHPGSRTPRPDHGRAIWSTTR